MNGFATDDLALSRELSQRLRRTVEVRFGRARHRMVVARTEGTRLTVLLNEGFALAPLDVRDALARWLRAGRRAQRATERLQDFLDELARGLPPPKERVVRVDLRGRQHDLGEIAGELLVHEFNPDLLAELGLRITWGRRGPRKSVHSLELGSFDPRTRVVRIHPVLDQPAVPRFFVRYVLFHELLHAVFEPRRRGSGRACIHGADFRHKERAYSDYARAMDWQARHIHALLRSARSARPMRSPLLKRPLFGPET